MTTHRLRFESYAAGRADVTLALDLNPDLNHSWPTVLRWDSWEPTEEGYHAEGAQWWAEDWHVWERSYQEGRDCDGTLESETLACRRFELRPDGKGVRFVGGWERVSGGRRDAYAEAAGY